MPNLVAYQSCLLEWGTLTIIYSFRLPCVEICPLRIHQTMSDEWLRFPRGHYCIWVWRYFIFFLWKFPIFVLSDADVSRTRFKRIDLAFLILPAFWIGRRARWLTSSFRVSISVIVRAAALTHLWLLKVELIIIINLKCLPLIITQVTMIKNPINQSVQGQSHQPHKKRYP